jgi:YVTN family beta-propeller protein
VIVIDPAALFTPLVPAGTFPVSVAANLNTNKIYVPNRDRGNVTVIDGATNTTATVASGSTPIAVAVNPVTNRIYVANQGSNNVTVIDGATNSTATVVAGSQPLAVAVNPVTNKIYVANNGSNNVTVIDGTTNSTTTVAAGAQPVAVAVNPVTDKIYVADLGNSVTVIDGATNLTTTIADGGGPSAIAMNPVTNKIYVANSGGNSLTVIDGATNSTTTISTGLDLPIAVDVNPITNKIYFANVFDSVTVLDGATNAITTITVGQQPVGVVVNPATNKIYVANSGDVNITVIDGPTNTILATIPSGLSPTSIALNRATNTVYTTTAGGAEGKVFVIQEKRAQLTPVQAAIAPFPGNISGVLMPTFHLSAAPLAPPVEAMYMQIDSWQGPWTAAASDGGGQFTATPATPLQPGVHIAYAWADPQDDTSSTVAQIQISATPIISNIAAYAFMVSPPSAGLSATSLDFGQQTVNTNSPARTVTLTNVNPYGPLHIGGISVSGHFLESDNCPAQLAARASCTISVIFSPTSSDLAIVATGTVSITDDSNGVTNNVDTIALSGTGKNPVPEPTSTIVSSSDNPSPAGQAVTFTATVSTVLAGGTLQFMDNGTPLNSPVTVSGGVAICTTSSLTPSIHSITAVYSGDINFTGSSSPALTQVVTAAGGATSTTTTLTTAPQTSFRQAAKFSIQVTATSGTATGKVILFEGNMPMGSAVLLDNNGAASLSTPLRIGPHNFQAVYLGDSSHGINGSFSALQKVNASPRPRPR